MKKSKLLAALLTAGIIISTVPELNVKTAHAEDMYIVDMNISYHDFYNAYGIDTMENVASSSYVDAVTSATVKQSMMNDEGKIAGGTYYELSADEKTSYIRGVTFPVMVDDDLRKSLIKDEGYDIGDFTLVDDVAYSGNYIVGKRIGKNKKIDLTAPPFERKTLINVKAELSLDTNYGDYQLKLSGTDIEKNFKYGEETVYGVILNTRENGHYPMYAMENVWKNTDIAWSVGFVNESKKCPLRSDRYAAIMGQTIKDATFIKKNGMYTINFDDIYVPKKTNNSMSVEEAKASAETSIGVNLYNMPDGYKPDVTMPDVDDAKISQVSVNNNNNLTKDYKYKIIINDAVPGEYLVSVKDGSKKYADISSTAKIKGATPVFDTNQIVLQGAEGGDSIENYYNNIKYYEVTEPDGRITVYMTKAGVGITNVANLFSEEGIFDEEVEFETIEKVKKTTTNLDTTTTTGTTTGTTAGTTTGTTTTGTTTNTTVVTNNDDEGVSEDDEGTVLGSGYVFPDDGTYKVKVVSYIYDTLTFTYERGADTEDDYKIDTSFTDKTVTYKNNFYIDIAAKAAGSIKYKSSNKAVAEIDSKGVIWVKGAGTADIVVSTETATKNLSILVKPGKTSIKSVKNNANGTVNVKMTKSPRAGGYQVKYTSAGQSGTVNSKTQNCKIAGLKAGQGYNIKVRAYKRIDGKMYYSAWSAVSRVNVNR